MEWGICLGVSLALLLFPIVQQIIAKKRSKQHVWSEFIRRSFVFFTLSVFVIMFPVCRQQLNITDSFSENLSALNYTVRNTFMVFSLDSDYMDFRDAVDSAESTVPVFYSWYGSLLFAFAPVLSFGVALSFLRKLLSKFMLMRAKGKKIYIFSDLSQQSCMLGESILMNEKDNPIKLVYPKVSANEESDESSLENQIEKRQALVLKDGLSVDEIVKLARNNEICYFAMKVDDDRNLETVLVMLDKLKKSQCKKFGLYVFTEGGYQSEMIGSAFDEETIRAITDAKTGDPSIYVRRVNVIQEIVLKYFYENNLFRNARKMPDGTHKLTFAVIGFGLLGREVTKNLLSCLQLEGYELNVHVFDGNSRTFGNFKADCPELWEMNNRRIPGDSSYNLVFHESGNDGGFSREELERQLNEIPDLSEIFVLLGDDGQNIDTSVNLRIFLKRRYGDGNIPIHTIVYNDALSKLVSEHKLTNYKNMDYNIDFIGRLSNIYTYEELIGSELVEKALERHLKWVNRDDAYALVKAKNQFYIYEYYFKSSLASVVRRKMRTDAGLPVGTDEDDTRRKRLRAEHMCWNTYMRCEGYCYGERDDLAKLHNDLVPFDKLPEKEQEKDDD